MKLKNNSIKILYKIYMNKYLKTFFILPLIVTVSIPATFLFSCDEKKIVMKDDVLNLALIPNYKEVTKELFKDYNTETYKIESHSFK
jgi:hypothetical protein